LFTYDEEAFIIVPVLYLEVYMFKAVLKGLVITLMLIAFVGQAIAFNPSVTCETSVNLISPNFSERIKHFDSSSIDTDSSEDCCGIECCGVDCTCIANACSSLVDFNTEVDPTKTVALTEVVYIQQSEQPKSISTLLYRPPIFTS
jgi:hypothetical protein